MWEIGKMTGISLSVSLNITFKLSEIYKKTLQIVIICIKDNLNKKYNFIRRYVL